MKRGISGKISAVSQDSVEVEGLSEMSQFSLTKTNYGCNTNWTRVLSLHHKHIDCTQKYKIAEDLQIE